MNYTKIHKGKYKYLLNEEMKIASNISVYSYQNEYLEIDPIGYLTIKKGYAWDGASGVAIDTETFMRASLVHDALYQLLREGAIPKEWRKEADKMMRKIAINEGMWRIRAWYAWAAVRVFGGRYAK